MPLAYRVESDRSDSLRLGGLEATDRVENFLAVQPVLHSEAALKVVIVQVVQERSVHRRRDEGLLVLRQSQRLPSETGIRGGEVRGGGVYS